MFLIFDINRTVFCIIWAIGCSFMFYLCMFSMQMSVCYNSDVNKYLKVLSHIHKVTYYPGRDPEHPVLETELTAKDGGQVRCCELSSFLIICRSHQSNEPYQRLKNIFLHIKTGSDIENIYTFGGTAYFQITY